MTAGKLDTFLNNREEKSLCHIVMVAIFLDDNKQKTSLKKVSSHSCKFLLSSLFNFIFFFSNVRNFLRLNPKGLYLSLEI